MLKWIAHAVPIPNETPQGMAGKGAVDRKNNSVLVAVLFLPLFLNGRSAHVSPTNQRNNCNCKFIHQILPFAVASDQGIDQ
jgi:hypothetical protein